MPQTWDCRSKLALEAVNAMASTPMDDQLIRAMGEKLKAVQASIVSTQNELNDLAEQQRHYQSVFEGQKRLEDGLLTSLHALEVETVPAPAPKILAEARKGSE